MTDLYNSNAATDPVHNIGDRSKPGTLSDGIGLCLSGGGYRAMLFHVGSVWRLNELGILRKLKRISSVSGGSITAGVLGVNWSDLGFDPASGVAGNFDSSLVVPIRRLAGKSIDASSVISGALLPGSISDKISSAYDRYLFNGKTLQNLPDDIDFVINATNVQTGSLWRFMKRYMADYQVGKIENPTTSMAVAVAASSAFPPILSPLELDLDDEVYADLNAVLGKEPFTTEVVLTDGGVYDNLGLETVWKKFTTVLVSDGGGKMAPEAEPKRDWARHAKRVLDLIDNQVRSLRKRQVIDSFKRKDREGAYWGIRTNIADYALHNALACPFDKTLLLAEIPTRLKRLDDVVQERLINWGYAVCDAAIRKYVSTDAPEPTSLPYNSAGVG
jgi:NTE family protein